MNFEHLFSSVIIKFSNNSFAEVQKAVQQKLGRNLLTAERKVLEKCIKEHIVVEQVKRRSNEDLAFQNSHLRSFYSLNFQVLTAYSTDYPCGEVCSNNNKNYCIYHGYDFKSVILDKKEMMKSIVPKSHCTWFKIRLILKCLKDALVTHQFQYLFWIDADALVINKEIKLSEFVSNGCSRDLIVSRDKNSTVVLNAGVILIRVCQWTLEFFESVWNSSRFNEVPFFEQSAIVKQLKAQQQDLSQDLCANVAFLKIEDFNCPNEETAKFIFHPAGKKNKFQSLINMSKRIEA